MHEAHGWVAYTVGRKLFEEIRRMLVKEQRLPLVMDLDYTLVLHANDGQQPEGGRKAKAKGKDESGILPRAGLAEFLAAVAPLFQLHVYTQAMPQIAQGYVAFLNSLHAEKSGGEGGGSELIASARMHVAARSTEAVGGARRELVACKSLAPIVARGALARELTLVIDDQFDGPDPGRRAKQLRDPRFAKKAVSLGTWATADKGNVVPVRKMTHEAVRSGAKDPELAQLAAVSQPRSDRTRLPASHRV